MKQSRHGENLWQVTRMWAFNCYLVREEGGLTLIDTNLSGSARGIVETARTIGLPIQRISVTHAHGDHAGSLDGLARLTPGAEIALGARSAEFLQGNRQLMADEAQTSLRGSFVTCQTKAGRLLTPGDKLGSLRVVAAPGHTPDQIAFFDERDGTLIAGDAFQTQAGVAVSGVMRWLFPFPAMATWHLPTAISTARALYDLRPSRLAVGHGPVLEQPQAAMEAAIREAEARAYGQAQTA